ncbi:hypothetical protein VTK56DRAFT_8106 [Thermocarpiscus australiensis]
MHTTALVVVSGLAAAAAADTVRGVLVFSRHGDRTSKHYGNQVLTSLGAQQVFQVGSDYRARYLASDSPHRIQGISEFQYVPSQVYASAPDSSILLDTATAFLQALYPPLGDIKPSVASQNLANGSSVSAPLSGYQYVTLHGIDDDSPETVWLKGEDNCPAVTSAQADFKTSAEYATRLASTRDFYRSLHFAVPDAYPSPDALSYAKAYDIFDLINVARIHNASSPAANVTDEQFFQLRTLADSAEFGANFNASQPARSIHGSTFAGSVLSHLNQTVSSPSTNPKLTLLAGSYDTFLAFFGLANLTAASPDFYGLPDYASTMSFELFTPGNGTTSDESTSGFDAADLRVRFLFRNGTEGTLTAFPLFGSGKADLSWEEFAAGMRQRGISTVEGWCGACQSEVSFCAAYRDDVAGSGAAVSSGGTDWKTGSGIAVLVIMSLSLAANLLFVCGWLYRMRRDKQAERRRVEMLASETAGKGSMSVRSHDGKQSV